jgi:hypothetical protein
MEIRERYLEKDNWYSREAIELSIEDIIDFIEARTDDYYFYIGKEVTSQKDILLNFKSKRNYRKDGFYFKDFLNEPDQTFIITGKFGEGLEEDYHKIIEYKLIKYFVLYENCLNITGSFSKQKADIKTPGIVYIKFYEKPRKDILFYLTKFRNTIEDHNKIIKNITTKGPIKIIKHINNINFETIQNSLRKIKNRNDCKEFVKTISYKNKEDLEYNKQLREGLFEIWKSYKTKSKVYLGIRNFKKVIENDFSLYEDDISINKYKIFWY